MPISKRCPITLALRLASPARRFGLPLLASAALLLLIELVWRLRFETNDDLAFSFMMMGGALLPPQPDFYFFFRGGLGNLLVLLVDWFGPSAYGFFIVGLLLVAMARWFQRIPGPGPGPGRWEDRDERYWLLMTLALTAAVFLVTFLRINHLRVAFIAVFVGFSGIAASAPRRFWSGGFLLDCLLLLVGYAVRPQAGMLAIGVVALLELFGGIGKTRLLRLAVAGVAVFSLFSAYDFLATNEAEREYIERNTYFTRLVSQRTEADIARPSDPIDRARLSFIHYWFLLDENTSNALLRDYVKPTSFQWRVRAKNLGERFGVIASAIRSYPGRWLAAVVLWMIVEPWVTGRGRKAAATVGKVLSITLCLLAVETLYGTKARVLEPVLAALVLNLLAGSTPFRATRWRRTIALATIASLLVALVVQARWNTGSRQGYDRKCESTRRAIEAMDDVFADKIVLASASGPFGRALLWNRPLAIRFPSEDLRFVPLQGWLSQFPDHRSMIDRLGNGEGLAGMLQEIQRRPEAFVWSGGDLHRFLAYARSVYDTPLFAHERREQGLGYFQFVSRSRVPVDALRSGAGRNRP